MSYIPIPDRHTPERHHGNLEIIDHPQWIKHLAQWIEPVLYVEYGIRDGRCLEQIAPLCTEAWGVDIEPYTSRAQNYKHHQMTTRAFHEHVLQVKKPIIDLAFIDAWHASDVVVQDFEDLYPFVAENGFVVLHDTYPIDKIWTNPIYTNDCWKTPAILRAKYGNAIELLTLPIMPGLTLIRKCEKGATPAWLRIE